MKQEYKDTFKRLNELNDQADAALKRRRGLEFEVLLNNIFNDEKILLSRGYHTEDNKSEQVDGAIEVFGRIFLLEIKWVESNLAASDLYAFLGKVENKFNGTLGVFISRNQLTENFINSLNKGRRQSVIVIHGDDIDQIFKNKFSFKSYLTYVFKLFSYDNITHYPVAKYLQIENFKNLNEPDTAIKKEVKDFINQNLLSRITDKDELLLEVNSANKQTLELVFSYVVNHYVSVWNNALSNLNFFKVNNFLAFLESLQSEKEMLKKEAANYYSRLLPTNFTIYSNDAFIQTFSFAYKDLPQQIRIEFEQFITKFFDDIYGDWDTENKVTMVVAPIWDDLEESTRSGLSKIYLDILTTSRQNKFPQKAFALDLASHRKISKGTIEDWLFGKIENAKQSYSHITDDTAAFIASTYWPVGKYLDINIELWLEYIKSLLNRSV